MGNASDHLSQGSQPLPLHLLAQFLLLLPNLLFYLCHVLEKRHHAHHSLFSEYRSQLHGIINLFVVFYHCLLIGDHAHRLSADIKKT